jgi:hypothetical protein
MRSEWVLWLPKSAESVRAGLRNPPRALKPRQSPLRTEQTPKKPLLSKSRTRYAGVGTWMDHVHLGNVR